MRLALTLAATTVLTLIACDDVAAQQKQSKQAGAPATQYWMDVATHSMAGMPAGGFGMPGMGAGSNHFGATRGGGPGKYVDLSLLVRGKPAGVDGTHSIPPGMAMGASLPLRPDPSGRSESGPESMERPKGRLLLYWGCDVNVRAGQPRIIDMRTATPAQIGAAFSGRYSGQRGARSGPGYSIWPNRENSRQVPTNASLAGEHRVSGDGVPASLAFQVPSSHDFMPAVDVTAKGALSASIPMEWRPVSGATGYFAHATGQKGDDMIIWNSSEVADAGFGLLDYVSPGQVERWTRERVIMPTSTTRCSVPAGIFQGTDGALGRLIAYGPELGRTHPAGTQNPEWGVRLRVWSTGMALLGEERGGRGRGGSGGGSDGNPLNTILRGIFR